MEWRDSPEGPAALFHYLLNEVDTSSFNPKGHAPSTSAKRQMIAIGRSEVEDWIFRVKESLESVLKSKATLYTAQQLLGLYQLSRATPDVIKPNTFAMKLGKHFSQWGRRNLLGRQPAPIKELNGRPWIISTDASVIAALNKLNGRQILQRFSEQHPSWKFAQKNSSVVQE